MDIVYKLCAGIQSGTERYILLNGYRYNIFPDGLCFSGNMFCGKKEDII